MDFPKELLYTTDHEWARKDGGTYVIGITAFAVEQLGDITLVDLPEEGDEVNASETFGTIESVKSVSDLFAPMAGKVVKINEELEDEPELINTDPYGKGWLVAIEPAGDAEVEMMNAEAYAALVAEQE
jgi:glycine cleavage system H protein